MRFRPYPLVLACFLAVSSPLASARAQPWHLTEEQAREIEYHYKLDQFMVSGCMAGAAFGAVTGVLALSGISVGVAPYISTGCSLGFLMGPAVMMVRDFFVSSRRVDALVAAQER